MEYISLLGLLVGVNCQPVDVAAGGQSVYIYMCVCVSVWVCASVFNMESSH